MKTGIKVEDTGIFQLLAPRVDIGSWKKKNRIGQIVMPLITVAFIFAVAADAMVSVRYRMVISVSAALLVIGTLVFLKLNEKKELLAIQVQEVTKLATWFGPDVFEMSRDAILADCDKEMEDAVKEILQIQADFGSIPKINPKESYDRIQAVYNAYRLKLMKDLKELYDTMLSFGVVPEGGYAQYFDRFADSVDLLKSNNTPR